MNESILTSLILPLSLAIIMVGMGLTLVVDDFKRVVRYPKAVAIGLFNQLLLLPLVAFALATVFQLSPELSVGLMILAACPGGVTSNLITHVSRGDTALSITLTAIGSCITIFSIPIIISWALVHFMSQGQAIELDVLKTIGQVFVITVLPVSLGMLIKNKKPRFAERMEGPSRIASTVIFILIVVGIILANKDIVVDSLKSLGLVTLSLNVLTMALGFFAARIFSLKFPQALSITIESGIQNGTLAIVIATTILQNSEMSLPAAVYSIMMFVTGGILMAYFGRGDSKNQPIP